VGEELLGKRTLPQDRNKWRVADAATGYRSPSGV